MSMADTIDTMGNVTFNITNFIFLDGLLFVCFTDLCFSTTSKFNIMFPWHFLYSDLLGSEDFWVTSGIQCFVYREFFSMLKTYKMCWKNEMYVSSILCLMHKRMF